jgi:hypothetical protein
MVQDRLFDFLVFGASNVWQDGAPAGAHRGPSRTIRVEPLRAPLKAPRSVPAPTPRPERTREKART